MDLDLDRLLETPADPDDAPKAKTLQADDGPSGFSSLAIYLFSLRSHVIICFLAIFDAAV